MKVMEQRGANKDIASIYTYLFSTQDSATQDLARRYLLDQSFRAETNRPASTVQEGILLKIDEKSKDKESWYSSGRKWLNEQDNYLLNNYCRGFADRHMAYLL